MIYKGMLGIVITTIIIIALSYRGGLSGAQDSTQTGLRWEFLQRE